MTTREMIEVMTAFEQGVVIEFYCPNRKEWFETEKPLWDWCRYRYRIAPKPEPKKYRPFTAEEFKPHRDRWIKSISSGNVFKCLRYDSQHIDTVVNDHTYSDLSLYFVFDDDTGEPCGVEI